MGLQRLLRELSTLRQAEAGILARLQDHPFGAPAEGAKRDLVQLYKTMQNKADTLHVPS